MRGRTSITQSPVRSIRSLREETLMKALLSCAVTRHLVDETNLLGVRVAAR